MSLFYPILIVFLMLPFRTKRIFPKILFCRKTFNVQGIGRKTAILQEPTDILESKLIFLWSLLYYWSVLMPKYQFHSPCLERSMFIRETKIGENIHCVQLCYMDKKSMLGYSEKKSLGIHFIRYSMLILAIIKKAWVCYILNTFFHAMFVFWCMLFYDAFWIRPPCHAYFQSR